MMTGSGRQLGSPKSDDGKISFSSYYRRGDYCFGRTYKRSSIANNNRKTRDVHRRTRNALIVKGTIINIETILANNTSPAE